MPFYDAHGACSTSPAGISVLDLITVTAEPREPNTGRMVDYWLGGSLYFPVDAAAAAALDTHLPVVPQIFAVLRRYIGRVSRFIHAQGIDQLLVLGAGIPSRNNVHEAVPGARVLYTDIDPINIEIGQALVAGIPNVGYTYADARDLSTLDPGMVEATLGPVRRLGIVAIGVSMFLDDAALARTFADLYAWAPEGSILAFDLDILEGQNGGEHGSEHGSEHGGGTHAEVLAIMGDGFHLRTPQRFAPLLGPWRLGQEGIVPVNQWGDAGDDIHLPTFMHGGVAYK